MDCGTATAARGRTIAVAFWAVAGIASVLLGATLAETPVVLVLGFVVASGIALLLLVWQEPRWGLIATLVLLYSYAGWVLGHRAGAPDLTIALLPLLLIILLVRRWFGGDHLYVPRQVGAVVLVGVAWALSAAFASDPARSAVRIADFVGWALLIALMVSVLDTTRWYRRALWGIAGAAGLLAALTVFQALTGSYGNNFYGFAKAAGAGSDGVARSAGPLQANNFAQILVVAAPFAWYLALSAHSRAARVVGFAAAGACVAAIGLTGSRGGFIALAAVFALIVVLRPVSRRALIGGAAAASVIALLLMPSSYTDRVSSLTSVFGSGVEASTDSALRGRASENLAAVRMFADHPLVGVGVANFPVRYLEYSQKIGLDPRVEERQPHSLYLEAFAELGVVGAAALFYLLWLTAIGPWRARMAFSGRERLLAEGTFVGVCGYLASALFLHGAYPRYLWIVVGLGLTADRLAAMAPRRPVAEPPTRADGSLVGRDRSSASWRSEPSTSLNP